MKLTELFLIDGKPIVAPDADMGFSFADLDGSDSGRDEAGVMHRDVIRHKVGAWSFSYSNMTDEELNYMESLFGEKAVFSFTYPSRTDPSTPATVTAYRSKYSTSWFNAKSKLWRNYKFNIVEC